MSDRGFVSRLVDCPSFDAETMLGKMLGKMLAYIVAGRETRKPSLVLGERELIWGERDCRLRRRPRGLKNPSRCRKRLRNQETKSQTWGESAMYCLNAQNHRDYYIPSPPHMPTTRPSIEGSLNPAESTPPAGQLLVPIHHPAWSFIRPEQLCVLH